VTPAIKTEVEAEEDPVDGSMSDADTVRPFVRAFEAEQLGH
jgi:hypothetical protein